MNRYALSLLVIVVLLFSFAFISMVFNTTSAEVIDRFSERSTYADLIKQMLYALFSGVFATGVWFIGYQNLIKLSGPLLIAATLMLVLVFFPDIGQQINGAHRWINLFGNSFQPSEFVKFLIPLYFIHAYPKNLRSFLLLLAKISIPIGLILIEPDNGTVAIIFASLIILFFLFRIKWTYWVLPLCIFFSCGAIVASQMHHVSDRIKVYLNPEYDLKRKRTSALSG